MNIDFSHKKISLLGSTGSIGRQTIETTKSLGVKVIAIAAYGNDLNLLERQALELKPELVAVYDEKSAIEMKKRLNGICEVESGIEGVCAAAAIKSADTVVTAMSGMIGLLPTVAAIKAKKNIGLANKETLVAAGDIIMPLAKKYGVSILPVDSEHSAIFQCLHSGGKSVESKIRRIILTASGGPFFRWDKEQLEKVTLEMALKHPNWSMGKKISIDSATLMNKGLEFIEAMHLFGINRSEIENNKIEIVIHRESIIHSMVEFEDCAVIAQMSNPDMRLPIQYAITYPERVKSLCTPIDFGVMKKMTFEKPDMETFRCLKLCIEAARVGKNMPVTVNAANEAAVDLFLKRKIGFSDIPRIIEKVCGKIDGETDLVYYDNIEHIIEMDAYVKKLVYGKGYEV